MRRGTMHKARPFHAHDQSMAPLRYCLCGEAIVELAGVWWHLTGSIKAKTNSGPHARVIKAEPALKRCKNAGGSQLCSEPTHHEPGAKEEEPK